ncbi:hypothetical protein ACTHOQ_09910 [Solibacillus silvestris]
MFLDIIVLPTGEVIKKDEGELQQALEKNWITPQQYELAYETFYRVLDELEQGIFTLPQNSLRYRNALL